MAERICLGCMEKIKDKYSECPYCGYIDGTPAKEVCHIVPGTVLAGKYIVGRVVGYGGFGVTYIGYDGLLEKKIAIKEYLPSEFATRMPGQTEVTVYSGEREEQFYSGIEKFVEEGKRLAQFKEVTGIVRIFDSFTENKTAYIIMEYLEGETLKSRLERERKLDVEASLSVIMPILTALKEVHNIGIIHRDIAPDNIFLTSSGEVKLLDFGAARYATTTHSKSLSVIIKQGYAPEEQYRSRGEQGPWTDVYACGATLYKMLTGITPEDSMERAGKDTLQAPSRCGAKTSKNLDTAIMNAMNLRIEDRTQSAEEFEEELLSVTEVKRKKVHERKMDIGKWPLWIKLISGAAACGILTFGVLLATGVIHFDMGKIIDTGMLASNEVYAPNLVNYSVEQAEVKAIDSNLILQIVDKQNSDTIPKDKILSQNIQDGMVVEAGTTIEVAVSAGGEVVYLEELEGLTQEEAKTSLENLGLVVEVIEETSDIAPGCVIRYEAVSGDETIEHQNGIEKGSTIRVYISTGRNDIDENEETTVPGVVGMNYADASTATSNAKLYIYRIRSEYSATVPKGQVMEQNLSAGSKVKQGSQLGVVVSLGVQTTRVPDVQYKDRGTAASLLNSNNLTYEYQYEDSDTVAKDHVIRQSVAAGSEVAMQTKVVLYISNGNPNAGNSSTIVADNNITTEAGNNLPELSEEEKVFVPDLSGCTEAEARKKLEAVGLVLGSVTKREQAGGTDGIVFEQGITKNSKVTKGTVVSVSICDNSILKVTVPDVVGKSQTDAETILKQNSLNLVILGYRNDGGISANGTVLVQEHVGESVSKKTDIGVYLCDNSSKTQYALVTRTARTESSSTYSSTTKPTNVISGWENLVIESSTSEKVRTSDTVTGWTIDGPYTSDDTHEPYQTTTQYHLFRSWVCSCGWTAPCRDSEHDCGGTWSCRTESIIGPNNTFTYVSTSNWECPYCQLYGTYYKYKKTGYGGYWYGFSDEVDRIIPYYGYYPCEKRYTYNYHYTKTTYSSWSTPSENDWSDTTVNITNVNTEKQVSRTVYVYDSY